MCKKGHLLKKIMLVQQQQNQPNQNGMQLVVTGNSEGVIEEMKHKMEIQDMKMIHELEKMKLINENNLKYIQNDFENKLKIKELENEVKLKIWKKI